MLDYTITVLLDNKLCDIVAKNALFQESDLTKSAHLIYKKGGIISINLSGVAP